MLLNQLLYVPTCLKEIIVMTEQVIMIAMAAMKTECKTASALEQEGISQLLIYKKVFFKLLRISKSKTYHKLFMPNILILTQFTSGRGGIFLWTNFQPFLFQNKRNNRNFFFHELTIRQGWWIYLMEPRQRQGDMRGLFGSMLGSWHILQIGMEDVEDEWDMETGMHTPLCRLVWKKVYVSWV